MKPEKQLYQWDTNQSLVELTPSAQFVDYPIGDEVIRIEADGTRCRIPDEVLQTYGGKTCYERYPDGTFRAYSFSVLYAPKPPDYVYTTEERTTFEALTARVDTAIEEIKRRADSGEFDGKTPVKGVDYYTKEEQAELITAVSSGAESEFRKVTEAETAKFEATAESELATYNRNAAEKLEVYNSNHAAKVAEYNQNAAALQTEVDRLRGECDNLAAENRKQENKIGALLKLNKGQTYDILPEEGETASRTAPSGAKYVSVDKVGGKSVVWNQLNNPADNINVKKGTIKLNDDGSITISGTVQDAWKYNELQISQSLTFKAKMKYMVRTNKTLRISVNGHDKSTTKVLLYTGAADWTGYVALDVANGTDVNIERLFVQVINLTLAFGAGNEPTAEQFETMFPSESYQYNAGEIISSQTETITAGVETITAGFPELRSVGAVHDYIDMDDGEIRRSVGVVDLGALDWTYNSEYKFMLVAVDGKQAGNNNLIMSRYNLEPNEVWQQDGDGVYGGNDQNNIVYIKDSNYSDPIAFKTAMKGKMLQYELANPTTDPIAIPEALTEWLPVEAGGTVTFRNADETKQLPVPNAVSWVRKLNEVE